jgi:glycosyltransferase involved in cell wall biosynthesis
MTWGVWAVFCLARRLRGDLYHFHDPELMPVGVLLKLTTRARLIYDVHENYPSNIRSKEWIPRPLRRVIAWAAGRAEWVTASLVDGIVTVAEHIAQRFPPGKTELVRNYPALAMTVNSAEDNRRYEGNYTLVYTGGFTDHRGVTQIVQALSHVKAPEARLTLLGKTFHQRVAAAVQKMPGFALVDYLGQVPYEAVYRHMRTAAVGLICNQPVYGYELAQPNKLFEYMSAGLPVIASNFELWKEIVEGNQCGLTVDPTRPGQIAEAVDYLLCHPELRRQMGANARQAVQEKYNWDRESQKLISLYQRVLREC